MSIFKAYDVRGKYPEEINEEVAYRIGRAFVLLTRTRDIMIGIDVRTHSPMLRDAFIRGAMEQGADVIDIGLITTCQMISLKTWMNHDTAVMVTASHLDSQFNGFKMLTGVGQYVSEDYGMKHLEKLVTENEFPPSPRKGALKRAQYLETYVKELLKLFTPRKPASVFVADCSNGSIGAELELIANYTGINLRLINNQPDGSFPNHSPNPIKPEAQQQAAAAIKQLGAIGGCIFDADADRVTFLDEQGNPVHPNYAACILTKSILKQHPGNSVAYDLVSSRVVPETITSCGGKPLRTKVGRASVIAEMMKHNAVFGAETSSHIMFRDTSYGEATTLAMLMLIDEIAASNVPMSLLVASYARYPLLPETNYETPDQEGTLKALETEFSDARLETLDGVYFSFSYGWLSARKSNTEPLLRLRAEADTQEQLQELFKRAETVIQQHAGVLSNH